jgi:hypothetical protein
VTDNVQACGIDEPDRLLAIDLLLQMVVEECIGDVELMSQPLLAGDKSKHGADGGGLGCDNPPRKILYYRVRPIHFGH